MILSLSPAPERRYARARAATLSDIFEERGYLVLATSNKTHLSVGTANLFGDLAGRFAPLKDCPKTLVYELSHTTYLVLLMFTRGG